MGSKPWLYPSPTYRSLETYWDIYDEFSGPRCGHPLNAVAATKNRGPRFILFNGSTAIEGGLDGVTNTIHSYDVLTRKWTRKGKMWWPVRKPALGKPILIFSTASKGFHGFSVKI